MVKRHSCLPLWLGNPSPVYALSSTHPFYNNDFVRWLVPAMYDYTHISPLRDLIPLP